jgi:hypothetical protein
MRCIRLQHRRINGFDIAVLGAVRLGMSQQPSHDFFIGTQLV